MTTETKKYIILSALANIIIAILVFLVILPSSLSIADNKKAIAKSQNELDSIQRKTDDLKKIARSKNTAEMLQKINSLWPNDKEISAFIINLENLAKEQSLTFDNLSIAEIAKAKPKKSGENKSSSSDIQFSFSTSGGYDQVMTIIRKLESFSRFNAVSSIQMTRKDQTTVSMQITGLIYYGD